MSKIQGIKIDYETADRIVVETLKQDYLRVSENIRNIENLMKDENCPHHVAEDYKYDRKLRKAIKRVLTYYQTSEEVQKFFKETK